MGLISYLLCQTATITPFIREGAGEPIYGDPETRPCRMERGLHLQHTYKNPSGSLDQSPANAKMFCEGEKIPERSLVTCDGQTFVVINCEVKNGFADNHLEVYLE